MQPLDESALRKYTGVYQWGPNAFVYLQMWDEFSGFGKPQLVAFDESGDVRTLYPTGRDQFFAGAGAALSTSIESRIAFERDSADRIASLAWQRDGGAPRTATRVEIETRDDVQFTNRDVQLTGTLNAPSAGGRHPAIVLVHGVWRREPRVHVALGAIPDSSRHRSARVRQTGRGRINRRLECRHCTRTWRVMRPPPSRT